MLTRLLVAEPDAGEVLADAGPAVVEQYGAALVEGRGDLAGPVGAQLGLDELHELLVEVVALLHGRLGVAELAEQVTRGRGEYAVLAGDRRGDLVERGGVDHRALATTGGGQVDLHALRLADRLDGVVDDRVEVAQVDAEAEVAAAGRGPVAETRGELGLHVA